MICKPLRVNVKSNSCLVNSDREKCIKSLKMNTLQITLCGVAEDGRMRKMRRMGGRIIIWGDDNVERMDEGVSS